jgi:hypothetical protein
LIQTRAVPERRAARPESVRRALALALVLGACQDAEPPASAPATSPAPRPADGAPSIESAALGPVGARVGDDVTLELRARDPDGDLLETEVDWYVNRKLHRSGRSLRLRTGELREGDEIYVQVRVRAGAGLAQLQSRSLQLGAVLPRVGELRLVPELPLATQPTRAEAKLAQGPRPGVSIRYEWSIDGAPYAALPGDVLAAGALRRGQRVRVRAAARDAGGEGPWLESEPVLVGNSPPLIETEPVLSVPEGLRSYEYRVGARDPDADRPLRYELVEGPDNMDMDFVSGVVSWRIPDDASGELPVEIAVRDAHGGRTSQRYSLELRWQEVPAADSEPGERGPADR